MAKEFKRIERLVAKYLGGDRDWADLHDCSVTGNNEITWVIEVKSEKWVSGPGALWSLLENAKNQLLSAMEREGIHNDDKYAPLVVYWPTYCPHDGSALAYYCINDTWVVTTLQDFKKQFIDGGE